MYGDMGVNLNLKFTGALKGWALTVYFPGPGYDSVFLNDNPNTKNF